MEPSRKATRFARILRRHLGQSAKSQREIARSAGISAAAMNRLCKYGLGSDDHVVAVLEKLNVPRNELLRMLTDRQSELSSGKAKQLWSTLWQTHLSEDEYLAELCQLPLELAFACTYVGIPLTQVIKLSREIGIVPEKSIAEIPHYQLMKMTNMLAAHFESNQVAKALSLAQDKDAPEVLLHRFQVEDVTQYGIKLDGCKGKVIFGIPHLVLASYEFTQERGYVGSHQHDKGVEFLYSQEGVYELTYAGRPYPIRLLADDSVFIFKASHPHKITLVEGDRGRLFMGRYYPAKRWLLSKADLLKAAERDKKHQKKHKIGL